MNYLRDAWARAKAVLVSMPPSQRYTVAALLVLVAASLVLLVTSAGKAQYAPVLTELDAASMAGIDAALRGTDVKYRIAGGTLLVEPEYKDRVLMDLVEKNALPTDTSKSFGFEDLVAPKGLNLDTQAMQRMKHNIALGNMLSRQIESMPDIKKAWVNIAVAEESIFPREQKVTAAVTITPRPGVAVAEGRYDAICRLVASAVGTRLAPEGVTVTNITSGKSFSLGDRDSSYGRASSRLDLQKNWDSFYADKVKAFLEPAFGQVQALVATKVDVTSKTLTETEYEVTQENSRSEQTTSPAAGGAGNTLTSPNVGASITTAAAYAPAVAAGSSTEEKERISSPSMQARTDIPPGEVTDIGIAVLVDQARVEEIIRGKKRLAAEADVAEADVAAECQAWRDKLVKAIALASGGSATSDVTFAAAPFRSLEIQMAGIEMPSLPPAGRMISLFEENWQRLALVALALVALLMIRSVARQSADTSFAVARVAEASHEEEVMLPDVEIDMDQRRSAKMRESIEEMIKRDPHSAVSLIRRWLARES